MVISADARPNVSCSLFFSCAILTPVLDDIIIMPKPHVVSVGTRNVKKQTQDHCSGMDENKFSMTDGE